MEMVGHYNPCQRLGPAGPVMMRKCAGYNAAGVEVGEQRLAIMGDGGE